MTGSSLISFPYCHFFALHPGPGCPFLQVHIHSLPPYTSFVNSSPSLPQIFCFNSDGKPGDHICTVQRQYQDSEIDSCAEGVDLSPKPEQIEPKRDLRHALHSVSTTTVLWCSNTKRITTILYRHLFHKIQARKFHEMQLCSCPAFLVLKTASSLAEIIDLRPGPPTRSTLK